MGEPWTIAIATAKTAITWQRTIRSNKMSRFAVFAVLAVAIAIVHGSPIDDCPALPPHTPSSIFDLSPSNIKVFMSLGDSMTAAFGLMGRSGDFNEFRGLTSGSGGDSGAVTVSNFFKHYVPDLIGQSTGKHFAELPFESYYPNDQLNAAQSGAMASDLHHQVQHLLTTLKSNPKANMTGDWKVVNLLLGANDACTKCIHPIRPSIESAADVYANHVEAAIEFMHDNFPRTIFNVLPMFNVSQVFFISKNTTYCREIHQVLPIECTCAFDTTADNRLYLDTLLQTYGERIIAITNKWRAKNLTDFAVTYQPFLHNLIIPGIEYLSTLDCFHPSQLAHQQLAIASWNSMLLPWAQKPTTFIPNQPLTCPTADSRIWLN
eukprot:TRINITY_DN27394_c0_g1_i1.p2 TRINITY_DN27394_c0_g1~~TRINITY_DN27394_c0_g1_i1.p2  ORF type:complete len:377 (-),score=138.09 TRINITY_DN27394_c0_g1_i1:52-1182(-)